MEGVGAADGPALRPAGKRGLTPVRGPLAGETPFGFTKGKLYAPSLVSYAGGRPFAFVLHAGEVPFGFTQGKLYAPGFVSHAGGTPALPARAALEKGLRLP